ncbi:hypothetical protein AC1031_014702 [Aphanomyces cochlioides]|nr:hypothetical protein AC1031_014702 [Aphanomyces cochlioides]
MSWDLRRDLSTKYPWLQVNASTLEEFRAPFEWTKQSRDEDERKKRMKNAGRKVLGMNVVEQQQHHEIVQIIRKEPSLKQTPTAKPTGVIQEKPFKPILQAPQISVKKTRDKKSSVQHKPKISLLNVQVEQLAKELSYAKADEEATKRALDMEIEAQRAKLPLQFLFEHNLSEYSMEKGVQSIIHVLSQLQSKLLFDGFERWKHHTNTMRQAEIHEQMSRRIRERAILLLNRIASDCLSGNIHRAFRRWVHAVKQSIAEERRRAAIMIQKHVRRRRAVERVRCRRAEKVAQDSRDAKQRSIILAFEMSGRQHSWAIREHAVKIRARRAQIAAKRQESAINIQRTFRGYCARCFVSNLLLQKQIEEARIAAELEAYRRLLESNCILLQSVVRMFLTRLRLFNQRMSNKIASDSALTIQIAWRRKQGKAALASRFVKRRLSIADRAERDAFLARQRMIAEFDQRRENCAVIMQRLIRGFLARRVVKQMRMKRRLDLAARRVQASWRKAKGRYALHVRVMAQRIRLDTLRDAAAIRLQAQFRRYLAKKEATKRRQEREALLEKERARVRRIFACATLIACLFRRFCTRKLFEHQKKAAVLIQRKVRQWLAKKLLRLLRKLRHERRLREEQAASVIGRVARGRLGRKVAATLRRRHQAAAQIQKRIRGVLCRKAVKLMRLGMALLKTCRDSQERRTLHLALVQWEDSKALQVAIEMMQKRIQTEVAVVVMVQRMYRGLRGRGIASVKREEKRARNRVEQVAAREIQRIARGMIGRRRHLMAMEEARKQELRDRYLREKEIMEAKKRWLDQLEMEDFKAHAKERQIQQREREIAEQQHELARLEAQTNAYKLEATEALLKLKVKEKEAWVQMDDGFGNVYYVNQMTNETSWTRPLILQEDKQENKQGSEDDWEEHYNPHTGQIYRHNRRTGETLPSLDATQELLQVVGDAPAKETTIEVLPKPEEAVKTVPEVTETKKVDEPSTEIKKCWRCKSQGAVKECIHCSTPERYYCTKCYTKEHATSVKKTHDFKRLKADGSMLVAWCHLCEKVLATRHCQSCDRGTRFTCDEHFASLHATAEGLGHKPALHFRAGATLCGHSEEPNVATWRCVECQDVYCDEHSSTIHAKGKKKSHTVEPVKVRKVPLATETDAYCVECDMELCTKLCNVCGDGYCDACFAKVHEKGRKMEHTAVAWQEMALAGDWVEILDGKTPVYFNIVTKESTTDKPSVLLLGLERHRDMIATKTREKIKLEAEKESQLVALQEKVKALEEEMERTRRQQREMEILDSGPTPVHKKKRRPWWKSKKAYDKEREAEIVMSLMLTKQRQDKLHREAMEIGSSSYANAIVNDVVLT